MIRTHAERIRLLNNAAIAAAAFVSLFVLSTPAHAAWENPGLPTGEVAQVGTAGGPGITTTINTPNQFYKVTANDVTLAVAEQLQAQGVENKAEVKLNAGSPGSFFSADHQVKVVIHTLQVDTTSKRWQAQAYFVSNGKTETVVPIAGTYGALIDVPVLTRQFARTDVIEEKDITLQPTPERLLRKDTILDTKQLVGLSPKNGISPNRPIHTNEITQPIVIKKGDLVEMIYNTQYIHIKTSGIALEDGAKGASIRVKNQKSERAVSAQVTAPGRVQVAGDVTL